MTCFGSIPVGMPYLSMISRICSRSTLMASLQRTRDRQPLRGDLVQHHFFAAHDDPPLFRQPSPDQRLAIARVPDSSVHRVLVDATEDGELETLGLAQSGHDLLPL